MRIVFLRFLMLTVFLPLDLNTVPSFICVSIPKCGTYLTAKCITLLTGMKYYDQGGWMREISERVPLLGSDDFLLSHILPTEKNLQYLKDNKIKVIFVYRDPRDQVVSFAYHRIADPGTIESKICENILNSFSLLYSHPMHQPYLGGVVPQGSINNLYRYLMPWGRYPFVYVTQFEKLVGKKGGGNDEDQHNELMNISLFLGLSHSSKDIHAIMGKVWGNKFTFRQGKIGSWRQHFTQMHKDLFKQVAGQLLIDLGYETSFDW